MAVRVLTYTSTSLLYEKLIDDGVLREHGKLPPVLPIVIYNGGKRWTAAEDVAAMIASGGQALAPYQPSLRYYLLDEGRAGEDDLPRRNLVSALVALETNREREQAPALLAALIERLIRRLTTSGCARQCRWHWTLRQLTILSLEAIGSSKWRAFVRHVLPNIMPIVVIIFSINIGGDVS